VFGRAKYLEIIFTMPQAAWEGLDMDDSHRIRTCDALSEVYFIATQSATPLFPEPGGFALLL
jgi:hypothetical protein